MKNELSSKTKIHRELTLGRMTSLVAAMALALTWNASVMARDGGRDGDDNRGDNQGDNDNMGREEFGNGFRQVNLVADLPGIAMLQDTNLVNAWGISFGPNTPFWISDNGTGLSTLYSVTNDMAGMPHVAKQGLEVTIPGDGTPTGQLFNNTPAFHTNLFIFASEDGVISGWRPALGPTAEVLAAPTNTVYKGITLVSNANGAMLLAANFRQATIDVYDAEMNLTQFGDPDAPDGYAPFNVQNLHGVVFVTFAKQDDTKHDDVAGDGNGLVDVFNPSTGMFHRLTTGTDAGGHNKTINSPWGLAISPERFGEHSDELLVGNFGSGTIMSFDDHGRQRGVLRDSHEKPIVIDGLWALTFGNGTKAGVANTLYFTAGPEGESHGLFGSLQPVTKKKHGRGHGFDRD